MAWISLTVLPDSCLSGRLSSMLHVFFWFSDLVRGHIHSRWARPSLFLTTAKIYFLVDADFAKPVLSTSEILFFIEADGWWLVDKLRTLFEQLRQSKKTVEVDRDLFSLIVDVVDELKADISFSNGCRRVFGSVNLWSRLLHCYEVQSSSEHFGYSGKCWHRRHFESTTTVSRSLIDLTEKLFADHLLINQMDIFTDLGWDFSPITSGGFRPRIYAIISHCNYCICAIFVLFALIIYIICIIICIIVAIFAIVCAIFVHNLLGSTIISLW
jgi:hypothetical protein